MAAEKLRKGDQVKFRSGGGHGVIQWLGLGQGDVPMALIRWEASGALSLVEQEFVTSTLTKGPAK